MMLSEKRVLMRKYLSVFLAILALPCLAFVSTNVPLDHWSYDAVDKLIGQGLIDGSMMTTRPVSRFEMARHIAEADEKFQRLNSSNEIIAGIIERLKKEFEPELATIGAVDGKPILDFAKPIEDPYVKYMYARSTPDIENVRGDTHSNKFSRASKTRIAPSLNVCHSCPKKETCHACTAAHTYRHCQT